MQTVKISCCDIPMPSLSMYIPMDKLRDNVVHKNDDARNLGNISKLNLI